MLAWLLTLLMFARALAAGPEIREAPVLERPEIAAPSGGWWPESGQYATVYAAGADHQVARRLSDHAASAVPTLAARLGVPAGGTIDVYIAPTQHDFEAMQPGEPPEWADGTAFPQWGLIFLRSPGLRPGGAETLEQVLDHELVHVLVGRAFAPAIPPRWLQEGLAQYYAGELGPKIEEDLGSVVFGREQLFSLRQLSSGFYGDQVRARHAYAAAADFIGFVVQRYGEGSVRRLIAEMGDGARFEPALRVATGQDLETVEAAWRGDRLDLAQMFRAAMSSQLLWALGGVLLVIGWWRRRRAARRKLERWQLEDQWMTYDVSRDPRMWN